MKWILAFILGFTFAYSQAPAALPEALKPYAEGLEKAMKGYDDSVKAQKALAQQSYSAALTAARKMEEGAKRAAGVAAIDAEMQSLAAGPLPANAPDGFPENILTMRKRYIADCARAEDSVKSMRQRSMRDYLKQLEAMSRVAKIGKDTALATVIESEQKRVQTMLVAGGGAAGQ